MLKPLGKQAKETILSLIGYFQKERDNNAPLLPLTAVRERVASAFNIHIATINKISSTSKQGVGPSSPKRKRPRSKPIVNVDDFTQCAIRNTVYDMYRKKQHITEYYSKEKELFSGGKSSLRTVLHNIGFNYKKGDSKRAVMELPQIVLKRVRFLQQYVRMKHENVRQFVFLDETWVFQDGTIRKSWQNESIETTKASNVGGKRYIVLHAGSSNGFIPGAELIFLTNSQYLDYHGDMNRDNFLYWFEHQLLIRLKEPSIIVLDNTRYHSTIKNKSPTSSATKNEIQTWLTNNNIDYDRAALKIQLLEANFVVS